MAESRFRREDYAEFVDRQNAVYAAWKTNPDNPDPAVRWITGLIGKVDAIERGEVTQVDITDLSDAELMVRWARPKDDEPQTVSLAGKSREEILAGLTRKPFDELTDEVDFPALEAMPADLRDASFDELIAQSSPMPEDLQSRIQNLIGAVNVDLDAPPMGGDGELPAYDLDDLVADVSDENHHDEIPTGRAVGREIGPEDDEP